MQITIREPGSAITHFVAMMLAVAGSVPLLVKSGIGAGGTCFAAMVIFITSMIMLYGSSTLYHAVNVSAKALKVFRKVDHMMIFVMIAGSYTPVCLIVLGGKTGMMLMWLVWGIALIGMGINLFWITCPKWFSSAVYISLGWVCVLVFGQLLEVLPLSAFLWLLAGGIVYTIGGVIYALKLKAFNGKYANFGSHELFHLFVMGGSICHFIFMYGYVA